MATRFRDNELSYRRHLSSLSNNKCCFCDFNNKPSEVVEEYDFFWVTINIFPYNVWDAMSVNSHFMVVPKKHTDSLHGFSRDEKLQYMKIVSEYESRGYSIYTRSPKNKAKTISHQHTHLIKTLPVKRSVILYLKNPYLLIFK